ncbi:hypothetical protein [Salinarimonas ramus]|uniref:Uncharacterized protein n=1 Tax=Salinarimonas ramus TaxID=690164 RepID=A0A917VA32_9HYPH|nr:hypothetical protein [Salinarimonas ramus]GGK54662.1 hypothetical protein GCM10011322_46800 [Salinarimonas ramus]
MTATRKLTTPFAAGLLAAAALAAPALSDPILEDQGLYEKQFWEIAPLYDDLDEQDPPGVLTEGRDPEDPAGPAVDFRKQGLPPVPDAEPG